MLMPLKIAIKITAVPVLASQEGACGFSFLSCDRTASNCLCETGAGWWESVPKCTRLRCILPARTTPAPAVGLRPAAGVFHSCIDPGDGFVCL